MSLSYDLYLTNNQSLYLDIPVTPVPASASTLSVVYTSLAGTTIGTDTSAFFSINAGVGIRWTVHQSYVTYANSGMTYVISDGATAIVQGIIHVPPLQSSGSGGSGLTAIADQTVLGNISGSSAIPIGLTATQLKTMQTLVKGDVGLGNVDNTSDASKNSASVTLTNKTLTSPVINTPTGIVKGDVGLGNVDNTSDASKNSATATLTNKRVTQRVSALTDASTVSINTDNADEFTLLATSGVGATRAMGTPSGTPSHGDEFILTYTQDSSGSRALTFPTGSSKTFAFSTDLAAPTFSTAANAVDVAKFRYNSTKDRWLFVGIIRGF